MPSKVFRGRRRAPRSLRRQPATARRARRDAVFVSPADQHGLAAALRPLASDRDRLVASERYRPSCRHVFRPHAGVAGLCGISPPSFGVARSKHRSVNSRPSHCLEHRSGRAWSCCGASVSRLSLRRSALATSCGRWTGGAGLVLSTAHLAHVPRGLRDRNQRHLASGLTLAAAASGEKRR